MLAGGAGVGTSIPSATLCEAAALVRVTAAIATALLVTVKTPLSQTADQAAALARQITARAALIAQAAADRQVR